MNYRPCESLPVKRPTVAPERRSTTNPGQGSGAPSIAFLIVGTPVPKGSMKGFKRGGHVVVTHDNSKTRPWTDSVAWHAHDARRDFGMATGPVRVSLTFAFDKPPSTAKKVTAKITKPDIDKLARALLDGLTEGRLLKDDNLVVELRASKCFSGQHPQLPTPGCWVMVERL